MKSAKSKTVNTGLFTVIRKCLRENLERNSSSLLILSPNISTGWFLGKTVLLQHPHAFRKLNTSFCGKSFPQSSIVKAFCSLQSIYCFARSSSSREPLAPHHTFLLPLPISLFSANQRKNSNFVCLQSPSCRVPRRRRLKDTIDSGDKNALFFEGSTQSELKNVQI